MTPPAADDGSSPAPAATEGETTAGAGLGGAVEEGSEGKGMNVGAAAEDEEPDELEPEEEKPEEEEGEEEENEEEDPEEVEEEEDADEEAGDEEEAEGGDGEAEAKESLDKAVLMEPLAMIRPGGDDEPEDLEVEEEPNEDPEVEEEPEEEPQEVEEDKEDGAIGRVDGSSANDMNEMYREEHGNCGSKNKDKGADQLSSNSDTGGSENGDVQDPELAGGLEIFVDELPKDCVEEDIAMVFNRCGEIKSVRIVENSSSGNNKNIAFVCYAGIEAAKKALSEFKEGTEVKGKKVRVSACQDNDTLYLGNICKGWTKDQVLTTLKGIGIQECKIIFPAKGGSRGFAFLKFASHYYARAAFRRLMKPDATFGIKRSAKVSFYKATKKPIEDLMEAKKVYLEHVPLSWYEDDIKELCEEYGEIVKIDLFLISKNMESETISFIEFSSSKSALACVQGINNAKIVDGGFKLSACLARPKTGLKGNSTAVLEGSIKPEKEKDQKEKVVIHTNSPHTSLKGSKNKRTSQTKEILVTRNSPSNLRKGSDIKVTPHFGTQILQTSEPSEGKRKFGRNKHTSSNQRPAKRAQNHRNVDERQLTYQDDAVLQTLSNTSRGKRKASKNKNIYIHERPVKKAHNNGNAGGSSRSKVYASDLEPHAGFISAASQVHSTHSYDQRRIAEYDIHLADVHPYAREAAASRSAYSDYTRHADYEPGYTYVYPPPPAPSGSYYQGSGSFISRRVDY